ncbi:hypothetical protein L798_11926 [Zootermopsis nevadensis]|uniref:Uncharacterized protein n=1 Tax=Zootermopsis nevadensis TaxID=136037 RepID=A0A067QUV7_ZOONE|nr:hypothetical protein L798_11926 [Zootermopsis nevadensis]
MAELNFFLFAIVKRATFGRSKFRLPFAITTPSRLHQFHVFVLQTLRLLPEIKHETAQEEGERHRHNNHYLLFQGNMSCTWNPFLCWHR